MDGINILIWRVRENQVNVRGDGDRAIHEERRTSSTTCYDRGEQAKWNKLKHMMKKRILCLYYLQPGKGGTIFISMCTPLWIPIVMRDHILSGCYRIVSIEGGVIPTSSRTSSVLMPVTTERLRRSVQRLDKVLFFHQRYKQRLYRRVCVIYSQVEFDKDQQLCL